MATISKLIPGQTLWDKHKYKQGHTKIMDWGTWPVFVKEVHADEGYIIASWNGNPPRRMYENSIKKLKIKKPILQQGRFN